MPSDSAYERRRIERITEGDFWGAWMPCRPTLKEAVTLGQRGRRRAAYLALAADHRERLGAEWAFVQQEARERNRIPGVRRETLARAADVRRGRIQGWHSQVIEFGQRIDFNANFGESGQYGFHYLFWLVPLLDRYLLERNARDLARVSDIVKQYYAQRTRIRRQLPWHPVYYELGAWAKTCNLLPAYLAAIHADAPDPAVLEALLKLFLGFGRSLCRLQRGGYRAGNWQIVGAEALFRLGALFPELREAAVWRARARAMMTAHLQRDFYPDGGHKERCWSYGWMSLKGVIAMYEAGRRTGRLSPDRQALFRRGIRRAFDWFDLTLTPTGVCPAYGDGDLTRADDILAAAVRYRGPKRASAGPPPRPVPSVCLKPSGYAVMRDDATRASRYLNVNFGACGGWHTHEDLLDFNVWAFGEPIIEEVGRFDSYDLPLNPFFRSPEAHNQVVIDHHPLERSKVSGEGVVWRSTPACDVFGAWHAAFRPARIHRHILFKRGEFWFLYDFVEPRKETVFSVSSYLHSPRRIAVVGPGRARVAGHVGALIVFAHPGELKRLETAVDVAAAEVTAPRLYPERHRLRARLWAEKGFTGCLRFAMLLYPFTGAVPRVTLHAVPVRDGVPGVREAFEVTTPKGRCTVVFSRSARPSLALHTGGPPRDHHRTGARRRAWPRGSRSTAAGR